MGVQIQVIFGSKHIFHPSIDSHIFHPSTVECYFIYYTLNIEFLMRSLPNSIVNYLKVLRNSSQKVLKKQSMTETRFELDGCLRESKFMSL
jgi:hypothetical protein